MNELTFRLRIEYGKTGRLCYLSHLELVRAMERVIRRSQLPFALSKGFNVHMRHAFGPALPVGTAGLHELLDIWLSEYVPAAEALARLRQASVFDLPIHKVAYCAADTPSLQVSHVLSCYEACVDLAGKGDISVLKQAFIEIIERDNLTIMKKGKPKEISISRSLVDGPTLVGVEDTKVRVFLTLRAHEDGSLRPELILKAALAHIANARLVELTRVSLLEESKESQIYPYDCLATDSSDNTCSQPANLLIGPGSSPG
ncbi:MAG: TIGR03936 family radical SAM-associated protein [Coriobacteriia bacterium]|nr:TIGR03936 family radical SAM-associated protein [Coriobacteriia bacterium]